MGYTLRGGAWYFLINGFFFGGFFNNNNKLRKVLELSLLVASLGFS